MLPDLLALNDLLQNFHMGCQTLLAHDLRHLNCTPDSIDMPRHQLLRSGAARASNDVQLAFEFPADLHRSQTPLTSVGAMLQRAAPRA